MGRLSIPKWLKRIAPLLVLLWIAGILFPFEWPAHVSAAYHKAFYTVFFAQWTHETTHFFLYAVLGGLLAWGLGGARWGMARRYAGAILAAVAVTVAAGQEGIQLLGLARGPAWPEVLDVAVDIAGAGVGAIVYSLLLARARSKRTQ